MEVPVTRFQMDFSRTPNPTEKAAFTRRLQQLRRLQEPVGKAVTAFTTAAGEPGEPKKHLVLRSGFSYRTTPAPGEGSDRRVPPRLHRPPATRISSSRGAALRLELIALGLAQFHSRPGRAAKNTLPLRPNPAEEQPIGWIDLLASPAEYRGSGRVGVTVNDKKLRQLQKALSTLDEASLVALPKRKAARGAYEGFQLLDERGPRAQGDPLAYQVPTAKEVLFELPMSFLSRGWVHVLEDSEIALLMMTACGLGKLPGEQMVAIPAEVRLLHYGISRDAFGAHYLLEHLGLLEVDGATHYADGRAERFSEDGVRLHRLRLLDEAFDRDPVDALSSTLNYLLTRGPGPTVTRS